MLLLKDQMLRHVTSLRLAFSYRRFEEFYFHVQGQAVQRLDVYDRSKHHELFANRIQGWEVQRMDCTAVLRNNGNNLPVTCGV